MSLEDTSNQNNPPFHSSILNVFQYFEYKIHCLENCAKRDFIWCDGLNTRYTQNTLPSINNYAILLNTLNKHTKGYWVARINKRKYA